MCLHSLSVAGEGGWEKRGVQTLQFGSYSLEPALYQSKVEKRSHKAPKPKLMVWQVPVGGRLSPLGPA